MTTVATVAQKILSVNPATGAILGELEITSPAAVRATVERAKTAQPAWRDLGAAARIQVLRRFKELLFEQKDDVSRQITLEAGKPLIEALLTEVLVVLDATEFCIQNAYSFLRDQSLPHANPAMKTKSGHLVREPHGVIGIISPWNYPFSIPATETLAALVTGNAVILKPSELTSHIALKLAELLHQAGVPKDVFQVVPGEGATGQALVDSAIDKLIFTGSVATGKRIAQAAAARLLPVVLELGGKDPMLVLDDANLDVASSGAVWGAFVNAGQTCLSVERCYVHRKLYEPFLAACVEKTRKLRIGDGLNPEIEIGPLIHEKQLQLVESHIENARKLGARVLCGGHRLPDLGPNFYAPTVLADVSHDMQIMREETFGPVLPIMAVDSDDEAVTMANDSAYGLAASVWTGNRSRGEALARRIQAGTVLVNDVVSCFGISEAPHGGVKASGIGRTHGHFGLEEMVRVKYLASERLPGIRKPWWYGYGASFARQMQGFVALQFASRLTQRLSGAIRSSGLLFDRKQ
jgi:succinate-semialdehyde dehydrogenase/glutarate-semialdehyde dehydrogenase